MLDAKLIFDDHIRCMAAKQRLNRGRKQSRSFKHSLIAELFGMRKTQPSGRFEGLNSMPTSPLLGGIASNERIRGITPGFIQKLIPSVALNDVDVLEKIPPDPDTSSSSSFNGKIYHV